MKQNKFGELVFSESDLCTLVMQGHNINKLKHVVVDSDINVDHVKQILPQIESLQTWSLPHCEDTPVLEFHQQKQKNWHMPHEYKQLDIAEHVLGLCTNQDELQRCGQELLLYQEHDLFDLLKYLKYLVDLMTQNNIIWGVGRGSSVSSYVLYKLGVHKINSMYYNLDIHEFLR
jgi:DNA polymerase III alpha subunit